MNLRSLPKAAPRPSAAWLAVVVAAAGWAQEYDGDVTRLRLDRVPVPAPSNLSDFVADEKAAIALGKALFWDVQVSSDRRMACASCHFNAGADSRSRGQLSPGLLALDAAGAPAGDRTFQVGGPNHQLVASDFPLRRLADPDRRDSEVLRDANDAVGSQGVHRQLFEDLVVAGGAVTEVARSASDAVFSTDGRNLRRVSPRNAPTVINAVFNRRNFWDGRAQDVFNGVNALGLRDPDARVWRAPDPNRLESVAVRLDHSSLASQAVAPVLSSFEMAAAGRSFVHVAKRLLLTRPLATQQVHPRDSALAGYLDGRGGIAFATYGEWVKQAFRREWWQGVNLIVSAEGPSEARLKKRIADANNGLVGLDSEDAAALLNVSDGEYTQMQANFALFFGLAIQMYESTLVSDQAPIDRYAAGDAAALTALQRRGVDVFFNQGRCASCHSGPAFTAAAPVLPAGLDGVETRVEIMPLGPGRAGIYDGGFYNIGVRPSREDPGLGGRDVEDLPLAEARLVPLGNAARAELTGVFEYVYQFPTDVLLGAGLFKTPTLRNVELTAPYFHNGGQGTLEQVVDFYNRGGDFVEEGVHENVRPLELTAEDKKALVAFLRALTDERVRTRRAPFDHPSIRIPDGQVNDAQGNPTGVERWLVLNAVGADGGAPLPLFPN